MSNKPSMKRRNLLKSLAVGSAFAAFTGYTKNASAQQLKGRIKQSISRGARGDMPWDDFCRTMKDIGLVGIDLVGQNDWKHLKKHGLVATMCPGAGSIVHGLNELDRHDEFRNQYEMNIQAAADAGYPNVICMAGSRYGISDEEGLEICHLALKRAVRIAERRGVTICMELLNSKVDHPAYMCDSTEWGADLCRRVASPNFKLLYDIYHMQIMEGDIIRTIRRNIEYIGHFHTAGNPGRQDLDDEQELNYVGIMKAIAKLQEEGKFDGYVAHEFGPKHRYDSVREAVKICDV